MGAAAGVVLQVATGTVHEDPEQVRSELGDLSVLTASVRAVGVQQPIIVRAHPDPERAGEWMIVFGARRHAAAVEAGRKTVPVIAREDLAGDGRPVEVERLVDQWHENEGRKDLTVIERAAAMEGALRSPPGVATGCGAAASR